LSVAPELLAPPDHLNSRACALSLTCNVLLVYGDGMSSKKIVKQSDASELGGTVIDRTEDVLTFTLDNAECGNEVTGAMFDAMLAELRTEAAHPSARVLRVRARGKVFCTGRERAGRDVETIHREAARILEFKRALRTSSLISVAEVQGDAFGFGFGFAIVCDFVLAAEHAALGFPEMRAGLAPSAIMAYLESTHYRASRFPWCF
jgi:methylglutaconyl-CoA hydratase